MSKTAHGEKMRRQVCASISIRLPDRTRVKLELMPASDFGGPAGLFRVRVGRRYVQAPDGKMLFLDRDGLARLATDLALQGLPAMTLTCPDLPVGARVSVRLASKSWRRYEGAYTLTPPFFASCGRWMVCLLASTGREWVYVDDLAYDSSKESP